MATTDGSSAPEMPCLDNLPPELIAGILAFLIPSEKTRLSPRRVSDIYSILRTCKLLFSIALPILYRSTTPSLSPAAIQGLLSTLSTPRSEAYISSVRHARLQIHGRLRTIGSQEYENRVVMELTSDKLARRRWLDAFGWTLRTLEIEYMPVVYELDDELTAEHPESVFAILERVSLRCPFIESLGIVGDGLHPILGGDSMVYFAAEVPLSTRRMDLDADLELAKLDLLSVSDHAPRKLWARLESLQISRATLSTIQTNQFPLVYRSPTLKTLTVSMREPSHEPHLALATLYGGHLRTLKVSYPTFRLRESERSPAWFLGFETLEQLSLEGVILSPGLVADIAPLFLRVPTIKMNIDGNPGIRFGNSLTVRDPTGFIAAFIEAAKLAISDIKIDADEKPRTEVEFALAEIDWFEMREAETMWLKATSLFHDTPGCFPGTLGTNFCGVGLSVVLKEKTAPSRTAVLMVEREVGFVPRDRGIGRVVRFEGRVCGI